MIIERKDRQIALQKKLIIFDWDDTLTRAWTSCPMLTVVEQIGKIPDSTIIGIATNQGGVGLRRWMEVNGFGKPEQYPTHESVEALWQETKYRIFPHREVIFERSYAYQSYNTGQWAPKPTKQEIEASGMQKAWWYPRSRKPSPGMIKTIMAQAGIDDKSQVVMVGNSDEDRAMSLSYGIDFIWSHDFFDSPLYLEQSVTSRLTMDKRLEPQIKTLMYKKVSETAVSIDDISYLVHLRWLATADRGEILDYLERISSDKPESDDDDIPF